jgi:hypothetical protein
MSMARFASEECGRFEQKVFSPVTNIAAPAEYLKALFAPD